MLRYSSFKLLKCIRYRRISIPYKKVIFHHYSEEKSKEHIHKQAILSKYTNIKNYQIQSRQVAVNLMNQIKKMILFLQNNPGILQQYYFQIQLNQQYIRKELQLIIVKINNLASQIYNSPAKQISERKNFLQAIRRYIINNIGTNELQSKKFDKLASILLIANNIKNFIIYFNNFGTPLQLIKTNPQFLNKIELLDYKNQDKLNKQYKNLQIMMRYVGGIVADTANNSKLTFGNVRTIWSIFKGISNYQKTFLRCLQMHFKADFGNMFRQIGFADQSAIRPFLNTALPKITSNVMIYIPLNEEQERDWNILRYSQNSIPVRVLYHDKLPFQNDWKRGQTLKENVMFHIHGGGFVSNSSYSSQGYTRVWANQTKMIIFSIDYGQAPKHPFPRAVQDCQRVYDYMMKKGCYLLKISPKNIYIGGDSVGGNLTCGLTALILKNNLPRPKGLFLVYPFLDLRRLFYGSKKLLIADPVFWPSIAVQALDSYLPKPSQQNDPLASPILLTKGYISGDNDDNRFPQNWPTTYMHVGSDDALRDETFIFMQRMIEANVPCKCTLAVGLKHAYLSTDAIVTSSKQIIGHSARMLCQLMEVTAQKN